MDEIARASAEDLDASITWELDDDGGLNGVLRVRNIADRAVRVAGKPSLRPVDAAGRLLDARTVVTLELAMPDYVDLRPGEEAHAPVGWAGWDGPPASGELIVDISGAELRVRASGPLQPAATGPATNLWSSWFGKA